MRQSKCRVRVVRQIGAGPLPGGVAFRRLNPHQRADCPLCQTFSGWA